MRDFPSGGSAAQLAMFDTEKGDRFRAQARDWVARNHGTWLWFCKKAAEYSQEGRRFSIAWLVEEAIHTRPVAEVDQYKVNHNIRRPLADMLVEAVPQCAPYIERRASVCDL